MITPNLPSLLCAAALATLAIAHPGEHEHHDVESLAKRQEYSNMIKRGLSACESNPNYAALQERAMKRRFEKAQSLRKKRSLQGAPAKSRFERRDLAQLEADEAINHNMTGQGYTENTSAAQLFASYDNSSCILAPEVTYGPYYVSGEYFRTNVSDGQEGIPIHLEFQYIDVNTCETPADDLYIETWSCNSTGVYSGVVASGNGNIDDTTNINKTFLRGVTQVDEEGVGAFDALFPGHYLGRTTHIHIMTHINGTVYPNSTYRGDNVAHVGQVFFDEDLKSIVEATYPYNTNTQAITTNDEDDIAQGQAEDGYDPFPDWTYLGDDISDGLLMWISVGINTTASYDVTPAADLTSAGGVMGNNTSSFGGGNGTSNGTMPSGTPPAKL